MDKQLRLTLTLKGIDQLSGPLGRLERQTERAGKACRETRSRLRELGAAQKDVASYRGLQQSIVSNGVALQTARQRAEALKREYMAAEQPTAKLTRAFSKARDEVQNLEQANARHREGLRDLETKLSAAGVDTRRLSDEEARLGRETALATNQLDEQRRALDALGEQTDRVAAAHARYQRSRQYAANLQSTGQSALVAGAAIAAPAVLSGREAMGLQTAMAEIQKVVDFETPQQFQQMRRDILDLADAIPMASSEIAEIMALGGRANIAREDLRAFATDAAMMGVAFDNMGATAAGETMATWRTAFRMTQEEVRELADQVNYLGNNSAAGVEAVTNIVTRVGPLGEVGGLAGREIAALGATMAAMGVDSDRAGTGIQNLILGMTRGSAATARQRNGFRALGLDAVRMSQAMQQDATGAIMQVLTRLRALPEAQRAATLSNLFGRESIGAIAPLLTNLEDLQTHLEMVGDASIYAGSMRAEFERANETSESGINLMLNALKGLSNEFGQQFLPQIRAVTDAVRGFATGLRGFAAANPGVMKAIGMVLIGLSALLIIFGSMAIAIATVLGPFALMRLWLALAGPMFKALAVGAWGAVKAFWAFNAALLANPITWVVVAVAALAAAAWLIVRNWSTIAPWLSGLWDTITSSVVQALAAIGRLLSGWAPIRWVVGAWAPVARFFGLVWDIIAQSTGLGLDLIGLALLKFNPLGWIGRTWAPVPRFVTGLWQGALGLAREGLGAMGQAILAFAPLGFIIRNWRPMLAFAAGLWLRMRQGVATGIQSIRDAIAGFKPLNDFKATFAELWTWLTGLPARLARAGAEAMRGFANGIRGRRAEVQAEAAAAAGAVEQGARTRLQIRSPSRVFAGLGDDTIAGLVQGLHRSTPSAVRAIAAAGTGMASALGVATAPGMGLGAGAIFDPGPGIGAGAPGAALPSGPVFSGPIEIHVHPSPGMSPGDVANEVRRVLGGLGGMAAAGRYADDGWGE